MELNQKNSPWIWYSNIELTRIYPEQLYYDIYCGDGLTVFGDALWALDPAAEGHTTSHWMYSNGNGWQYIELDGSSAVNIPMADSDIE